MSKQEFFPEKAEAIPTIYAYKLSNDTSHRNKLKIGFTNRTAQGRIREQIGDTRAEFQIVIEENAMRNDGSAFTDFDVHNYLRKRGFKNPDGEWFECTEAHVKVALIALKSGEKNEENRTLNFAMRPEHKKAVEETAHYFNNFDRTVSTRTPEFLWNAKMRFGKTFTAYQLAKAMNWKKVLVLTFKQD
ncbi:GIY-YIG nuclease family protein [Gelidibacter japonicus]|uniref:GIY-YIG nuclease family protein n=2 Tax=Gelidibacter japonicus TaxID=1962232 RepID=UPI00201FBD41|nr:GIY-YIG nuclease family protein [Gelidibacter japonicus]MCL8009268.1 GIY-YIG nuclease family protein [Gelidibacter japonicus]